MARTHAGESTPDRYADGSLAALPGVYRHPRRLWYLGLAAGALETWRVAPLSLLVLVVGMASCAAAGETLSGSEAAGAALTRPGSISTFSVCVWCGLAWRAGKKKPRDGAIHKYACNGITGRAAGSTARQVRQIYHCRPPYD